MNLVQIPFAVHSYQSRSLPLSAQRLVNLYPESAPQDAKSPVVLHGTPGLKSFADTAVGPVRALHVMDSVLFAVSSSTLYEISSSGGITSRGTVAGTGRVKMVDNGSTLLIQVGVAAYTWNGSSLAEVTDGDLPDVKDIAWIDNYFVVLRSGTAEFYISSNGTAWDALDFSTAEGNPDDAVALAVDHRELWVFGTDTTEVYINVGDADFPFRRISGGFIERGCADEDSVAKMDNTIFWQGDDLAFYRADGYTPRRISTHAMEAAVEGYDVQSPGRAFTYAQEGHAFYCVVFEEGTWVYDANTQMLHERTSLKSDLTEINRWRANDYARAYDKHIVADYLSGQLFELDLDTYDENGNTIIRTATSPPIHNNGNRINMARFELQVESGAGLISGQGSDPQVMLDWSDDGGKTFSNEHWTGLGAIGDYLKRAIFSRLGQFRTRTLRIRISDPIKVAITGAAAALTPHQS